MNVELVRESDIDSWMQLVNKVRNSFPGLETGAALEDHRNTVLTFIRKESAICARVENRIVGALLFSKEHNMLCFLAVDPEFRRQHIGKSMVSRMLPLLDTQKDIVVTTYREGVPEGNAARAFYRRIGFVEGALTEEFGCPVQEFILRTHNPERR